MSAAPGRPKHVAPSLRDSREARPPAGGSEERTGAPYCICLLGAESTGKTTLAQSLAQHFDCPWVGEYLREFCATQSRTPTREEQALVLEHQHAAERSALAQAEQQGSAFVFCDTAPLLTAIYSEFIFADHSLHAQARRLHSNYALTLLLAPDIDWVADGLQREGEWVRAPITQLIQRELVGLTAPFASIKGQGVRRLAAALQALGPLSREAGLPTSRFELGTELKVYPARSRT